MANNSLIRPHFLRGLGIALGGIPMICEVFLFMASTVPFLVGDMGQFPGG